jgi:hypothetical protein
MLLCSGVKNRFLRHYDLGPVIHVQLCIGKHLRLQCKPWIRNLNSGLDSSRLRIDCRINEMVPVYFLPG